MLVPIIALICLLILLFTPIVYKVYESCYYPLLRAPQNEVSLNLLSILIISLCTTCLYAITGGSLVYILKPSEFDSKVFLYGAFLGSIVFFAGRVWALNRTHSFAQSNLFLSIIIFSSFTSLLLFFRGYGTMISDKIMKVSEDQLNLLAILFLFATISAVLSELFGNLSDFILKKKSIVSYSLLRQQIEHFEKYERIRDQQAICNRIKEELRIAISLHNGLQKPLKVLWCTANGDQRIKDIISDYVTEYKNKIDFRIIAHDSGYCRANLESVPKESIKYIDSDDSFRFVIIGNYIAFLGIQMGPNRHDHFPDYVMLMTNKYRVGKLDKDFEYLWSDL
jgi:hypothetical protein